MKRAGATAGSAAGWGVPALALVLLPKCPMCLAAYFALAGVAVSMGSVEWIERTVMVVSVAALGFLTARAAVRLSRLPSHEARG